MIKHLPEQEKMTVAMKRIQGRDRGLKYWSAVDYVKRITGEDLGDYSKVETLKRVG